MRLLACRVCGGTNLTGILNLGKLPLANATLTREQLREPEPKFALEVMLCRECSLAQLSESVNPAVLFDEYSYFSSVSDTMVEHVGRLAERLTADRNLVKGSLVVEVASNDGYLLRHYQRAGVPVLGIEPARNIAEAAVASGVPTLCKYFGLGVAEELRREGKRADVIHAHNVLAHVPDLSGFVQGIAHLLAPNGVAVIETPYLKDLVDNLEFDTVYHEHVFYYTASSLDAIFRRNGLRMIDVERTTVHGGSLLVFAARSEDKEQPSASVPGLLADEAELGISREEYYRPFARRVDEFCASLSGMIRNLKARGSIIAGYGAAAKAAVLLNVAGIGTESIVYVADKNPFKQGRFMPGVHIPIVPPERLFTDMPDYLVLLAWNLAEEIMQQQEHYRQRGGRFIVPGPVPRVI